MTFNLSGKNLSIIITGLVVGGTSFYIGTCNGRKIAEPIQAEVRTTEYEKYPALVIMDKKGREYVLFGKGDKEYISAKKALEERTTDILGKRNK